MKKPGKETCFGPSKQTFVVYSEGQAPSSYTVRESTFFDLAVCVSEPVHGSQVLFLLARWTLQRFKSLSALNRVWNS